MRKIKNFLCEFLSDLETEEMSIVLVCKLHYLRQYQSQIKTEYTLLIGSLVSLCLSQVFQVTKENIS